MQPPPLDLSWVLPGLARLGWGRGDAGRWGPSGLVTGSLVFFTKDTYGHALVCRGLHSGAEVWIHMSAPRSTATCVHTCHLMAVSRYPSNNVKSSLSPVLS